MKRVVLTSIVGSFLLLAGSSPSIALKVLVYKPTSSHNLSLKEPTKQLPKRKVIEPHYMGAGLNLVEVDCHQCEAMRDYLERMVHVYYRNDAVEAGPKLSALKSRYRRLINGLASSELYRDLAEYEKLCQCIHRRAGSGLTLEEIYARRLCGNTTTKRKRAEIVAACEKNEVK
jgi:hypothetical protein